MAATKDELKEYQAVTGLRLYVDAPRGVEIHDGGRVVRTFTNKGQAGEWLAGAAWAMRNRLAEAKDDE